MKENFYVPKNVLFEYLIKKLCLKDQSLINKRFEIAFLTIDKYL